MYHLTQIGHKTLSACCDPILIWIVAGWEWLSKIPLQSKDQQKYMSCSYKLQLHDIL